MTGAGSVSQRGGEDAGGDGSQRGEVLNMGELVNSMGG